jgi:hypothetical protein
MVERRPRIMQWGQGMAIGDKREFRVACRISKLRLMWLVRLLRQPVRIMLEEFDHTWATMSLNFCGISPLERPHNAWRHATSRCMITSV